jgi:hypothetical protein
MLGRASFAALDNLSTNFVASGPPISIWGMAILRGVAWGTNNVGIAVGQGNNYCLGMTTDGGNSWFSGAILSQTAPYYCMTEPINGATFGKNLFVITGNPNSAVYGAIKYSVNGSNWSTPTIPSGRGFAIGNGIAYHSSMFVAVGEGILGDRDGIGYSTDGSNWGWVSSIFSDGRGVCWGKDKWVAVGGGLHTIAYSLNGSNWTGLGTSIFTNIGRSVTWNGKYFIATGNGGNGLAYSSDGISWTGLGNSILSNGVFVSARLPSPVEIPPALSTSTFELKLFNWSLTGVTQITQQQVQKPVGGTSAWDARAASQESYSATATLSFQPAQTTAEIMMGLSETPSATTSYTALNYAFYMMSSGNLRIYELGVQVAIIGTYSTSDTLRITYDGTTVRYYQNSTLVRSVARALGPPLFLSSSFYTPGGAVQAVAFSPLAQLTTTQPTLSTTGYFVSQSSGSNTDQYGPFFQTLSTTINPGTWTFYATMDGTAVGSNSFYADIFLNGAKYFSTNTVTPVYATLSTYVFTAQIPSRVAISTTTVLDVRFRATRPTGNTFLYTNYTSADALSIRSSATILNTYNPNAIEYLQFYHTNSNTGLQTSELDISITQFSTQSTSYLQSNVGMDVYAGYLVWPSGLNGTTIENRYNDTVTRSLTYTGSLYTASDPRLKENIQLAPTATLYETMASLPLYRYRIREEHRATYRIDDTHQLGVLATDVAQRLQGATAVAESSGLLTVDSDQLFYTHLATTQHLQARISSLRARITRGF